MKQVHKPASFLSLTDMLKNASYKKYGQHFKFDVEYDINIATIFIVVTVLVMIVAFAP